MKKLSFALLVVSSLAFAAPPSGMGMRGPPPGDGPGDFDEGGRGNHEEREKRMRMMLVVGLADALELNESEALRLADRVKGFDEKRRPLREQMHDAMKTLKAAADNDAKALPQVDAAMAKLLDARTQLASMDKEMFLSVSKDLSPQKKAKLGLFLAKFHHEARGGFMKGGKGRFGHGGEYGAHHFGQHGDGQRVQQ